MIFVQVPTPSDATWNDWVARARKARDELIRKFKAGKRLEIDQSLYSEQKARLLEAFHYKCAYCEEPLGRQRGGDVEHFRPKLAVTDAEDTPVKVGSSRRQRLHPGYYWLAYDWDNLLPSCITCNQASTNAKGERIGKRNRFPVKGAFWAHQPGDEHLEQPLLINPRKVDPSEHFDIDPTGHLLPLTAEGKECIKIFDLNREDLVNRRKDAFDNTTDKFRVFINAAAHDDLKELGRAEQYLERVQSGAIEFAAFARAAFAKAESSLTKHLAVLRRPNASSSASSTSAPRVTGGR